MNFQFTNSQLDVLDQCVKLAPHYKLFVIRGDGGSGKNSIAKTFFNEINATYIEFNLCDVCKAVKQPITNQHITQYLEYLLKELQHMMIGYTVKKRELNKITLSTKFKTELGFIYIRNLNLVYDVLTDCYAEHRFLLTYVLRDFIFTLPSNINILATTNSFNLPERIYWSINLRTTKDDMKQILLNYVDKYINMEELDIILNLSKTITIGRLQYCMRYAILNNIASLDTNSQDSNLQNSNLQDSNLQDSNLQDSNLQDSNLQDSKAQDPNSHEFYESSSGIMSNKFINDYKTALKRFMGVTLSNKDVIAIQEDFDLIGLEHLIEIIKVSVINPMKSIDLVPFVKGILICGPIGTGKTSIGRWLANEINGKFYLIGSNSCGNVSVIEYFKNILITAQNNSPAIIFLDDCDYIFNDTTSYRGFLTALDGIDNNRRSNVCIIATCMNLRNIPSSLLRGGRLEKVLYTKLPDKQGITNILNKTLEQMVYNLDKINLDLSNRVKLSINSKLIENICIHFINFNCADIKRCVNDVYRSLVYYNPENIDLYALFLDSIKSVRKQYSLCGKTDSTHDNEIINSYIS